MDQIILWLQKQPAFLMSLAKEENYRVCFYNWFKYQAYPYSMDFALNLKELVCVSENEMAAQSALE
jgi:hypothetical protein